MHLALLILNAVLVIPSVMVAAYMILITGDPRGNERRYMYLLMSLIWLVGWLTVLGAWTTYHLLAELVHAP